MVCKFKSLKVTQLNNPIPFQSTTNNYPQNKKDIDFLSVGTIKVKIMIQLLHTIILKIDCGESKLYIAGRFMTKDDEKQIQSLIDKHNLKEKVVLLGDVQDINLHLKDLKHIYYLHLMKANQTLC